MATRETNPSLVLREGRDRDSAAIIRLIAAVFAEYPGCVLDVDREEPELRAPASSFDRFWVLDRGGEVVGCCAFEPGEGRRGELKKLYLSPEVRGRGHARRLASRVEARAREMGAEVLELWSDTRFASAHGFYERLGYRGTGRTRDLHDLSNTTELHFEKRIAKGREDA